MHTVPESVPQYKPLTRYATLHGLEGLAHRDIHGAIWFKATGETTKTLIHPVDWPALQLFGVVTLVEDQRYIDELLGGLFTIVNERHVEHARAEVAA
jgi:hypothetical protein